MLDVRYSTKFKKDFKLCVKRGYKMSLLQQAIDTLRIPAPLPEKKLEDVDCHPPISFKMQRQVTSVICLLYYFCNFVRELTRQI